ncbi:hypothetical protein PSCLAVI8L_40011 [Pseudoclavibacter sp. 8L]|nr:hypothetical protein PSCLAVI8L_40011 [Pseudoclavibacter sp. 8L]
MRVGLGTTTERDSGTAISTSEDSPLCESTDGLYRQCFYAATHDSRAEGAPLAARSLSAQFCSTSPQMWCLSAAQCAATSKISDL